MKQKVTNSSAYKNLYEGVTGSKLYTSANDRYQSLQERYGNQTAKVWNNAKTTAKKVIGIGAQGVKTGNSMFKAADAAMALQGSASSFMDTMRNNASFANLVTGGSAVLGDVDKALTQFGSTKKDINDLFNQLGDTKMGNAVMKRYNQTKAQVTDKVTNSSIYKNLNKKYNDANGTKYWNGAKTAFSSVYTNTKNFMETGS